MEPSILRVKRTSGVAGQYAYGVTVQYGGEEPHVVSFFGSAYGNPGSVVMVTPNGTQIFVADSWRYGDTLNESWCRRFFGPREGGAF